MSCHSSAQEGGKSTQQCSTVYEWHVSEKSHSGTGHRWARATHTIAFEMSEPYTSAPWSARGMDSDPVPQPAQATMNPKHLIHRKASSM